MQNDSFYALRVNIWEIPGGDEVWVLIQNASAFAVVDEDLSLENGTSHTLMLDSS